MMRWRKSTTVKPGKSARQGAFALVVVLIILTLLAVVAVGYLSSMTAERSTAAAISNRVKAEEAAQAGVDAAIATIREAFKDYPDSATVWDPNQSSNTGSNTNKYLSTPPSSNGGTTLFLRAAVDPTDGVSPVRTPASNVPVAQPDPRRNFALPLISGVPNAKPLLLSQRANLVQSFDNAQADSTAPATFEQDYTDLNVRRYSKDYLGAIGSPPSWYPDPDPKKAPISPQPIRAKWVNIKGEAGTNPPDNNSQNDVVTARYAYWVEDESFRTNVNYAGALASRGDNSADYRNGTTLRAFGPSDVSLLGPLILAGDSNAPDDDGNSIVTIRNDYPGQMFPEALGFKHAESVSSTTLDRLRFLTSTTSSSLNLSRHASRRFNLNILVTQPSFNNIKLLQRQVDQTVKTLQYHLPDWGQRFYRKSDNTSPATNLNNASMVSGTVGSYPETQIYYYKTAANIHDYVDTDTQPTLIAQGGNIMPFGAPKAPFGDTNNNLIWAQGKEVGPYLDETVVRFRPVVHPGVRTWDLKIDYYLEFWNMTDKDVYASPQPDDPSKPNLDSAFVRMTNQQTWASYPSNTALETADAVPGDPYRGAPYTGRNDYNIDLTNKVFFGGSNGVPQDGNGGRPLGVLFKAGTCTVITTDPDCASYVMKGPPQGSSPSPYGSLTGLPANTYYCANLLKDDGTAGKREFSGTLSAAFGIPAGDLGITPKFREGSQDYDTEVTLGNPLGYIDCMQFAIPEGGSPVYTSTDRYVGTPGSYNDYGYGGSLLGNYNGPLSQTGDPRTNNEQMFYVQYAPGQNKDQTRYWNDSHTLGFPNGDYLKPELPNAWPDYYKLPVQVGDSKYPDPTATSAPAVVADGALTSIGQLGDVFDAARKPSGQAPQTPPEISSRGGGRTYRLGQKDDLYNSDATGNAGPNNTVDSIAASTSWASWRLADIFCISDDIELPGRLNINGIARDAGAALRASLTGFDFQPVTGTDPLVHGDPAVASQALALDDPNHGFTKLIAAMTTRLGLSGAGTPQPFFERGEFGELGTVSSSIFGATGGQPDTDLVTGVDMNIISDRSREELVRRCLEDVCTRGDVFTVYAAGQSVSQAVPTGINPVPIKSALATQRVKVTFRLHPKTVDSGSGLASDFHPGSKQNADGTLTAVDFDPNDPQAVKDRFKPPDRYDVEILQSIAY